MFSDCFSVKNFFSSSKIKSTDFSIGISNSFERVLAISLTGIPLFIFFKIAAAVFSKTTYSFLSLNQEMVFSSKYL
jgi:hypothetical protein